MWYNATEMGWGCLMRSFWYWAFSVMALCAALPAASASKRPFGDYLYPVETAQQAAALHDDYPEIVTKVFHEAFESDVLLRVHGESALPLYEEVIFLRKQRNDFHIVVLSLNDLLFGYSKSRRPIRPKNWPVKPYTPPDWRSVKLARCEVGIPTALAQLLVEDWKHVLLETRYDTTLNHPSDAGSSEYSMELGGPEYLDLAGRTVAPDENTKPAMLGAIVSAMSEYCRSKSDKDLAALWRDTASLGRRLKR